MPLHEGLAEYALVSAFRDTRFNKIEEWELDSLECECVTIFSMHTPPFIYLNLFDSQYFSPYRLRRRIVISRLDNRCTRYLYHIPSSLLACRIPRSLRSTLSSILFYLHTHSFIFEALLHRHIPPSDCPRTRVGQD